MGTEDGTPEKPAGDRPGCLRSSQEDPGGGGGGGVSRPWRRPIYSGDREDFWQKQFKNVRHQERGMMSNPDHRTFLAFGTNPILPPSSVIPPPSVPTAGFLFFTFFGKAGSSFSKAVLNSCGLRARFPCVFESAI